MADPGFPVGGGGALTRWGGTNLQCVHFLVKTYVKTKEMDPVGGARASGAPPGSANDSIGQFIIAKLYKIVRDGYL